MKRLTRWKPHSLIPSTNNSFCRSAHNGYRSAPFEYDLVVDLNPLPYTLYILMTDLGLCDFFSFFFDFSLF